MESALSQEIIALLTRIAKWYQNEEMIGKAILYLEPGGGGLNISSSDIPAMRRSSTQCTQTGTLPLCLFEALRGLLHHEHRSIFSDSSES
jgi:hypothetical protein